MLRKEATPGFDEFGNPLAAIDNFTAAEQQQPLPPTESSYG